MGYFYIDESIHTSAGFIICACVYSNFDLNVLISSTIRHAGFDPEIFEFKSSDRYAGNPQKVKLRDRLKDVVLESCKVGIVILPDIHRKQTGLECLKGIKQFIDTNINLQMPLSVYFDQEIISSTSKANNLIDKLGFVNCNFFFEQNSKKTRGIQLADLTAHLASIYLKANMGILSKSTKAGENTGYDPETEIDIGFEMWATMRYTFFTERSKKFVDDPIQDSTFQVEPYGLYISEHCSPNLTDTARAAFGHVYLGCIH